MSRFIPSRGTVFWAFGLGLLLLVGGVMILVDFLINSGDAREIAGTVKEHHWTVPYKPGRAKVEFVFDGKPYFDTINTAPCTFFSEEEKVTLLYFPDLTERLQIKGFWQQYYIPTLSCGLGSVLLGLGFWLYRRRLAYIAA